MKTLKALKHWVQGYKLHPKEARRLEDLWNNIKIGVITILIVTIFLYLLQITGCMDGRAY
jgi:hypothetical protein